MAELDWIAVLEAAYDYAAGDEWMARVLKATVPLFPSDAEVSAFTVQFTPTTFRIGEVAVQSGARELEDSIRAANEAASPFVADACYRSGDAVGSLSEQVFAAHPDSRGPFLASSGGRFTDVLGVAGHTGDGRLVMLSAALARTARPTAVQRRHWLRAAAHVAAGARVRRATAALALHDPRVEAVLDGGGRLLDAHGAAGAAETRTFLRERVQRIDAARTVKGRRDSEAALAAWEGLVLGRWSLVDHFDADGRRFVVAVKNDPAHPDPRGLSERESQVAAFVGLGHSSKQIAYALGLSTATITTHASHAAAKLGLRNRAQLASFFSPRGVRARLAEVAIAEDRFLVGASAKLDEARLAALTPSEREVAALLITGSSNADIARRRGASERTVANQARAIYRKLSVGSRVELAAALDAAGPDRPS